MFKEPNMFADRSAAGRALARQILSTVYASEDPVVVCIPRGGTQVGREIALGLNCDLDVCMVKRVISPINPKQMKSIAAIGESGDVHLAEKDVWKTHRSYIQEVRMRDLMELKQRRLFYNSTITSLKRRTVILVDDGIDTGTTILAAVAEISKFNPAKIVMAVPVCSFKAYHKLMMRKNNPKRHRHGRIDDIIVLNVPPHFTCISQFYLDFSPVTDLDVMETLQENRMKDRVEPMPVRSPLAETRSLRSPSTSSYEEEEEVPDASNESDAIQPQRPASAADEVQIIRHADSDAIMTDASNANDDGDENNVEQKLDGDEKNVEQKLDEDDENVLLDVSAIRSKRFIADQENEMQTKRFDEDSSANDLKGLLSRTPIMGELEFVLPSNSNVDPTAIPVAPLQEI